MTTPNARTPGPSAARHPLALAARPGAGGAKPAQVTAAYVMIDAPLRGAARPLILIASESITDHAMLAYGLDHTGDHVAALLVSQPGGAPDRVIELPWQAVTGERAPEMNPSFAGSGIASALRLFEELCTGGDEAVQSLLRAADEARQAWQDPTGYDRVLLRIRDADQGRLSAAQRHELALELEGSVLDSRDFFRRLDQAIAEAEGAEA